MRINPIFSNAFKEIGHSIRRFPLTVFFLFSFAVINARMIEGATDNYLPLLFTTLVGALTSAVGQLLYEQFYSSRQLRYVIMGVSVVLAFLYYWLLTMQEDIEQSFYIRTAVALFALFIAFIWIPSFKNEQLSFHQSFLLAFKAAVTTLLFALVLTVGVLFITQAISFLLFELDPNLISHILNIIGSLFVPIYFLALTPDFINNQQVQSELTVSVILDRLLSFIVIPIMSIYTLVLIVYLVLNIRQDFWTDNLLEPLLVSYTIMGIVVVLLASNLSNRISKGFLKIFPKVFLPIVIFQTVASVLKIRETGITHGRYYVILFGVFAIVAGILFSLNRPRYYGWIAVMLLVLATVSIIPPVDAFSVSRRNQENLLEKKLIEVNLLRNDRIESESEVKIEDRVIITNLVTYLSEMGYVENIDYLPNDFEVYNDFSETFGFDLTYSTEGPNEFDSGRFAYTESEFNTVHEIQREDIFTRQYIYFNKDEDTESFDDISFTLDQTYTISREVINNTILLEVLNADNQSLIKVNATEVFKEIFHDTESNNVTIQNDFENATFIEENEQVRIKFLVYSLEDSNDYYSVDFYMFIEIK